MQSAPEEIPDSHCVGEETVAKKADWVEIALPGKSSAATNY
jgi:hypothetical protein